MAVAEIIDKRVTAEVDGPFVVFLIGMRINKFWKVWKWLPVFFAMPRMLRELEQRPESGFLGASRYFAGPRLLPRILAHQVKKLRKKR